jgi:hypothetical protein
MQNLKVYIGATIFISLGMICIFSAFTRKTKKEQMLDINRPPLAKKDSKGYRIFIGAVLIYGGLALLFS